ncbi:hypothetical protein BJ912DRAFT_859902 [Pholiota molesta]|nr:hypothetical protein BJ912DRAFT_859902 [Pholiota molesta]
MPALPRSLKAKAKAKKSKKPKEPRKASWQGILKEKLGNLAEKIKRKFNWTHTPHEFQVEAVAAQLMRKDVLIHAGTGSGKTAVAAGPFAHEGTEGMVSFMVSPLIALQEEQVRH